jgi:hypothetical protein
MIWSDDQWRIGKDLEENGRGVFPGKPTILEFT